MPPDDVRQLALAIEQLCRNPEQRDRLGRAGEERVRAAFDYNAGINQLNALFRHQHKGAAKGETIGTVSAPLEAKP